MADGDKLYQMRSQMGLTLQQAADIIGVHKSTLCRYEQGEFFTTSEKVRQNICRLYRMRMERMEAGADAPAGVPEETGGKGELSEEEVLEAYRNLEHRDRLRIQNMLRRGVEKSRNGT